MTRRQRLMATLRGEPVDRPAVNFYELTGFDEHPENPDPFNIYSHPSWKPLIELTRDKTDRIIRRSIAFNNAPADPLAPLTQEKTWIDENGSRHWTRTLRAGRRTLTTQSRRDPDIDTVWTIEHLLKDENDLKAWLDLPRPEFGGTPDLSGVIEADAQLGDTGIVMIDTADPLCCAASLFDMGTFTVIAMTEPDLFRRALDRFAAVILPQTEAIARAFPGHLWRICGPEYASAPYLPPALFHDYVVRYDRPMTQSIHRHGGYARLHCHGRIKAILDEIASTGCMGLDPIEPPPQGDIELIEVRQRYGDRLVLFGNLEVSDIETLAAVEFERKVVKAVQEGTSGTGRGFVLMPSASPYGRILSIRSLTNYETIIKVIERF